ncbi:Glyoxalase family protein [Frigoriglobus tundricola]|uniref:Glyoxalase family protein n=1 Tax=Frigoriglobus tundricola TaxID=2774151 RepID=A0A6M5Z7I7_9BACT|nr:VOC family protein [Frigoriglobus tundricola]QJX01183.1 Glyoxalase family protein [Frigoriglobus tundricola]
MRIGHVHLKVADLERALRLYCGVLGFQITQRYGAQAAFVSAGGELAMFTRRLDLNGLLREIETPPATPVVGEGPKDL